jgi:hypothetical protein
MSKTKKALIALPKTTIMAIIGAIIIYGVGKGWIGQDEAELISSLMVALGLSVNAVTRR